MSPATRKQAKEEKSKRYFTGKPCPQGHVSERYTINGSCCECLSIKAASKEKKEYDKKYFKENFSHIQKVNKERYERNKEKLINQQRIWAAQNPEKRRAISNKYKAKRRSQEKEGATSAEVAQWLLQQEMNCYWCGCDCQNSYHIDHYMPLALNGTHTIDNLVVSCPTCNLRKNAKHPDVFREEISRQS